MPDTVAVFFGDTFITDYSSDPIYGYSVFAFNVNETPKVQIGISNEVIGY